MRSALRALQHGSDEQVSVPTIGGIEAQPAALNLLPRPQVRRPPSPGVSPARGINPLAPSPDPTSKLAGVRLVMLPVGLGDARGRSWATQGSFSKRTYVTRLGENALDIAIQMHAQSPSSESLGVDQQDATDPQTVGAHRLPVAALIAEALRRNDVRTARGLLRGLADDDLAKARWAKVLQPPRAVRVNIRDRDRGVEYRALAVLRGQYRHRWAAIVGDRVIASALTLAELRAQLRERSPAGERPLVHFFD